MKFTRRWLTALGLSTVLGLSACGGGGDDKPPPSSPPPAVHYGKLNGIALASVDSQPLAQARVHVGALTATTGADGRFSIDQVPVAERQLVTIEADGYVDGQVPVAIVADQTALASARLVRAAAATSVDAAKPGTVTAPGGTASVSLPDNALLTAGGALASGPVSVRITAINPAADPQSMPGDYTSSTQERIESFGAVEVQLKDAAGQRLNLKPGSIATLRIPLASRQANPPVAIPLYYLDEATGLWVQEGSATLKGSGDQRYYEGSVAHFSYWNADQPQETIYVNGCVVDKAGRPFLGLYAHSVGVDYSGSAHAPVDGTGHFRVAIRKNSVAQVFVDDLYERSSNTVVVGPSSTDITLAECLVIDTTPVAPVIVTPPTNLSTVDGTYACFNVVVSGSRPLRYRWLRNGVAIADGTYSTTDFYCLYAQAADNGAVFSVEVSNAAGTVTSPPVTLTVTAPIAPTITEQPVSRTVDTDTFAIFFVVAEGTQPMSYQWLRNGVEIPGAVISTHSFVATSADNGARYSVRISNRAGSITSAEATLTVNTPVLSAPTITKQPENLSVPAGVPAVFFVEASGKPTPSYQWKRNGVDIPGATGPAYSFPNTALTDSGAVFTVVLSNSQGSVTSSGATLTVQPPVTNGSAGVELVRLVNLSLQFYAAGNLPALTILDETGDVFIDPADACSSGTLSVTLNGAPVRAGQVITPSGKLAGTANGCVAKGLIYDGSSTFDYTTTVGTDLTGTSTINNVRMRYKNVDGTAVVSDLTANGQVSVVVVSRVENNQSFDDTTQTVANGATLKNGLTGMTATFLGGSTTTGFTNETSNGRIAQSRARYDQLRFKVGDTEYLADGSYAINFDGQTLSGSGEVIVTSNGTRIGRLYVDAKGGLQIEADGKVEPFGVQRVPRAQALKHDTAKNLVGNIR